ncbi:hypothetical protein C9374_012193 [Naegleria lovaniensis]|uniref:Uncharacterized protein n=1 Tax=Naegleria lovaniensis TaxID=51637 RepID=A0AA88KHY3_NAELO|nr:uncharacterized protein C9374_012193 [Naegleria lovaniensis]KAG2373327.1 hypothetical protein C9374_012193 [Naegleria lovaniensis]
MEEEHLHHRHKTNNYLSDQQRNHLSKGYSACVGESHHHFQEQEGHQLGGAEGAWTFSSTTDPINSTSAPSISIMEEDDNPFSLSVPFNANESTKNR